ncbi:hypothetical protein APY03_1663 [Variovorax sp. WDL1]|nr:hypothetical protein APY03_1663 [Variovorax sp. WDL1]
MRSTRHSSVFRGACGSLHLEAIPFVVRLYRVDCIVYRAVHRRHDTRVNWRHRNRQRRSGRVPVHHSVGPSRAYCARQAQCCDDGRRDFAVTFQDDRFHVTSVCGQRPIRGSTDRRSEPR